MTYTEIYSPVLYPMWLMSFILIALVIDRIWFLRRSSIFDNNMIRDIQMLAKDLDLTRHTKDFKLKHYIRKSMEQGL